MKWFLLVAGPLLFGCGAQKTGLSIDEGRALDHLKAILAFGPRIPGTEGQIKTREYISQELRACGLQVETHSFRADTPRGEIEMSNLLAVLPGKETRSIVLAAHFDSKDLGETPFLGANDNASGTALLLELARVLSLGERPAFTLRFVFFDGEEAIESWSPRDSLYGSRELVRKWREDGTLKEVAAMVLLDMVGDRDLGITQDMQSTPWLVEIVRQAAQERGYGSYFFHEKESLEDDHLPFLKAGVPAVDLIDFRYGAPTNRGAGSFWHTKEDTLDKISPKSLKIVGEVVLQAVPKIERFLGNG